MGCGSENEFRLIAELMASGCWLLVTGFWHLVTGSLLLADLNIPQSAFRNPQSLNLSSDI